MLYLHILLHFSFRQDYTLFPIAHEGPLVARQNIKMVLREIVFDGISRIHVTQDKHQ
jgi:hypothetical protein